MSEAQSPDAIKKLVKFLICLAIFGLIIALAVYAITVLPVTPHAPANGCILPPPLMC